MNQSQRERLAVALSRCVEAVLREDPSRVRQVLEQTLLEVMNQVSTTPSRPAEPLDEAPHRKQLAGFLDAMVLAGGVLGRRSGFNLARRLFGDKAPSAERWLLDQGLVDLTEEDAYQITEQGMGYLEKHGEGKAKAYVGFSLKK